MIIEILDRTDQPDDSAIQFNFQDLADETNATDINQQNVTHFSTPELVAECVPLVKVSGSPISVHQLQGNMSVIPNKKAQGDRDYVTMLM